MRLQLLTVVKRNQWLLTLELREIPAQKASITLTLGMNTGGRFSVFEIAQKALRMRGMWRNVQDCRSAEVTASPFPQPFDLFELDGSPAKLFASAQAGVPG
ncbi:hypothetical protein [Leisingera sp. ANG-M7]|uniref:hypothetical protein n=1 Tax=Leisingera sp. ANG-M7 TaxID=1577902 RepID=UPI0019D38CF2|nr:hypothetical protein [Leisingera sp. ANG-M7]